MDPQFSNAKGQSLAEKIANSQHLKRNNPLCSDGTNPKNEQMDHGKNCNPTYRFEGDTPC